MERPLGSGARGVGGRGRYGDSEIARRGNRALPFQQHEACQRRGAGDAYAGARSRRRTRSRRPGGQQQRFQHVRGNGSRGMEKEIGSLESGKRADLIAVRIDRANAQPLYDVVSQMVYALKGSDVRDVMVNGKPVVRDAKILTLNEAQILAKAAEYRAKVSASLK